MDEFLGIPVSSGVAIGRVFVLDDARRRMLPRAIPESAVDAELRRFDAAIEASIADLERLHERAQNEMGRDAAAIFAFHKGMLRDPSLIDPIRERIERHKVAAEYAAQVQFEEVATMFASMGDAAFSTKVDDVWDLHSRVLKHLVGERRSGLEKLDGPAIIVAPDLTPSQAAELPRDKVLGFITGYGGPTSHTAIFARALGIPACVGVARITEAVSTGDTIVFDGDTGSVVLNPDDNAIKTFEDLQRTRQELVTALASDVELDARTTDGTTVNLLGNIEFGEEADAVTRFGGRGVGLFRTEFLWLTAEEDPTEETQLAQYREAVRRAEGAPVTIRTLDLGADKLTQARSLVQERNPFLGLRSIRLSLKNTNQLKTQLRAILRASADGPVRIMFPLVTQVLELRKARMILRDVMEDMLEEGIPFDRETPVGMMVEAPSAAVMAHAFAREVDFFSIGTNDLVQYTLAVDRTNERVADLYAPAHPAVLRLIKDVVRAARRRGIDCSICGEMAGDPLYTMLLIGIGLRSLSATPARLPEVKRVIRSVALDDCEKLARTVGSFDSVGQVNAFLLDQARRRFPELVGGRSAGVAGY